MSWAILVKSMYTNEIQILLGAAPFCPLQKLEFFICTRTMHECSGVRLCPTVILIKIHISCIYLIGWRLSQQSCTVWSKAEQLL